MTRFLLDQALDELADADASGQQLGQGGDAGAEGDDADGAAALAGRVHVRNEVTYHTFCDMWNDITRESHMFDRSHG